MPLSLVEADGRKVVLAYAEQAFGFLLFAGLLAVLSAPSVMADGSLRLGGLAGLAVAGVAALVGAMIAGWQSVIRRQVRDIMAAPDSVHWLLPAGGWQDHLDQRIRLARRIAWILPGVGGALGLATGVVLVSDDGVAAGTASVLGPAVLIGAGLGAVAGFCIAMAARWVRAKVGDLDGHLWFGTEGLYVTGAFWPRRAAGWALGPAEVESGPPTVLVVHAGGTRLRLQVPRGRLAEAETIAARLSR